MAKETFNVEVTFRHIGSATVTGLTQQQAWQVADVMRLIETNPPNYSESGNLLYFVTTEMADKRQATIESSGFLARLMRRFNAWAMGGCVIVALMLGASEGFAQGVRLVEPARVSLADDSTATVTDREFNELLRAEMNNRATIRFTSSRFDYKVLTATAPITSKGKLQGFAVAVGVLTPGESKELSLRLHVTAGPTLDALAKDVGAFLDKELQRPRRRR